MPDSPSKPSEYWIVEWTSPLSHGWSLIAAVEDEELAKEIASDNARTAKHCGFRVRRFVPAEQP